MSRTNAMTFADLKLRVAQRADLLEQDPATGAETPSTQAPDAAKLANAVADGVRKFLRAHPWSFLTQTCVLTMSAAGTGPLNIAQDPARYLLPAWVESLPKGKCMWRGPTDEPGAEIALRHIDQVATRLYQDNRTTGYPQFAGAEWGTLNSPGVSEPGRFEFMVYPKPDQDYLVRLRLKLGPVPFVADHQVGRWPPVHDLTVVDFAVVELFKHDRDASDPGQARLIGKAEQNAADSLAASIERDTEDFMPQDLGTLREETDWGNGRPFTATDLETGNVFMSGTSFPIR